MPSFRFKPFLQILEDKVVPAQFGVQLVTPGAGFVGITTATVSGELSFRSEYPPNADGYSIVEADSPAQAIGKVLTGTLQVVVGGQIYTYELNENTVGNSASEHKPFYFDGSALRLEDMAAAPSDSDWDYDDHFLLAAATPVTSTPPSAIPTFRSASLPTSSRGTSTSAGSLFGEAMGAGR